MSHYSAPIGKSSYDIPYDSPEDLPLLKSICKEANRLVNSVIASNPTSSNEFSLLLALVNIIYERNESQTSANTPLNPTSDKITNAENVNNMQEKLYSKQEVIDIISHLKASL